MRVARVTGNLRVAEYLGLSTEEFHLGWAARYTSPDTGANLQLITHDESAPEDAVISVLTDDIGGAFDEAQRLRWSPPRLAARRMETSRRALEHRRWTGWAPSATTHMRASVSAMPGRAALLAALIDAVRFGAR